MYHPFHIVPEGNDRQIVWNHLVRTDDSFDMDLGNVFAFDCAQACYSNEGDEWRRQMLEYVEQNIDFLYDSLSAITDRIKVIRPQASFLVFLDCRGLGFTSQEECTRFFADECHLCLNPGEMFGEGGRCYMRMNVGCPRSIIATALEQIKEGYSKHFAE